MAGGCCHCRAVEEQFGVAVAESDLRRYRRKGPDKTTAILLDAVRSRDMASVNVLDIGGGIGVIAHELLAAGAADATLVEAATAYIAQAESESERRVQNDRMDFVHGDFVEVAQTLPDADVVTLDRVVCCYPDHERLVRLSAAKCGRWYALSLPRARWDVKAVVAVHNALRWLRGSSFRTFVHSTAAVHKLIVAAGFERVFHRETLVWQVSMYARVR